jgi:hypothetical protein
MHHDHPPGTSAATTAGLRLAASTAVAVADALELAAELPTTPERVAAEAHATASELSQAIAAAGRHASHVDIAACCAVSAAGLLALLGGMPSTPPAVASDATAWSSALWDQLTTAGDARTSET